MMTDSTADSADARENGSNGGNARELRSLASVATEAVPSSRQGGSGKVSIIADHRERASRTCEWLRTFNAQVIEKQLAVADYIVSEQVGIERKTVEDFLGSIVSQRLFRQLEDLSSTFEKPLMIIEGDQHALFSTRDMHPNAIHGALSAIALDYRIPIIWTSTPRVTAAQIYWTGYREQVKKGNGVLARACKKGKDTAQLQEFIVCGLPGINTMLSRRLLSHFGSPREVFWASEKELTAVPGVGNKKAKEIHCLLNGAYFGGEKAPGETA